MRSPYLPRKMLPVEIVEDNPVGAALQDLWPVLRYIESLCMTLDNKELAERVGVHVDTVRRRRQVWLDSIRQLSAAESVVTMQARSQSPYALQHPLEANLRDLHGPMRHALDLLAKIPCEIQ